MAVTNYYAVSDEIIAEETGGARTSYLPDALGSVTATVDEAGAIENTYRYKPYGATLSTSGAHADPDFLWAGSWGYRDAGLDLWYVRMRHLDKSSTTWTTTDPLPGEIMVERAQIPRRFTRGAPIIDIAANRYAYSGGEPIRHIDYDGLQAKQDSCYEIPPIGPSLTGGPITCAMLGNHVGVTDCNQMVGKLFMIICSSPCSCNCICEHEQIHWDHLVEAACCEPYFNCLTKIHPFDPKLCVNAYHRKFVAKMSAWTECLAWTDSVGCFWDLIDLYCRPPTSDLWCCCDEWWELWQQSVQAVESYCPRVTDPGVPPCPFEDDGTIKK